MRVVNTYLNGNIRDLKLRVIPLGQVTILDLFDTASVGVDSLFLEIANKTVDNLGRDEV